MPYIVNASRNLVFKGIVNSLHWFQSTINHGADAFNTTLEASFNTLTNAVYPAVLHIGDTIGGYVVPVELRAVACSTPGICGDHTDLRDTNLPIATRLEHVAALKYDVYYAANPVYAHSLPSPLNTHYTARVQDGDYGAYIPLSSDKYLPAQVTIAQTVLLTDGAVRNWPYYPIGAPLRPNAYPSDIYYQCTWVLVDFWPFFDGERTNDLAQGGGTLHAVEWVSIPGGFQTVRMVGWPERLLTEGVDDRWGLLIDSFDNTGGSGNIPRVTNIWHTVPTGSNKGSYRYVTITYHYFANSDPVVVYHEPMITTPILNRPRARRGLPTGDGPLTPTEIIGVPAPRGLSFGNAVLTDDTSTALTDNLKDLLYV